MKNIKKKKFKKSIGTFPIKKNRPNKALFEDVNCYQEK